MTIHENETCEHPQFGNVTFLGRGGKEDWYVWHDGSEFKHTKELPEEWEFEEDEWPDDEPGDIDLYERQM